MMKNIVGRTFWVSLFGIMLIICLSGCNSPAETSLPVNPPEILLGYCPTMTPFIHIFTEKFQTITPVRYDSAGMAMDALNTGAVHAVIIGRVARDFEISETLQLSRLKDGFTLIALRPGMILYDDLRNVPILTTAEETTVQNLLPEGTPVQYYQEFGDLISDLNSSSAVLLHWSEVSPTQNLLIPVDQQGNKVPNFRSPHLYYLVNNEENLSFLVSEKWD